MAINSLFELSSFVGSWQLALRQGYF